jgi:hypothetical protein
MAIINADKDELFRLCTKMGVGDLYGLFAVSKQKTLNFILNSVYRYRQIMEIGH